MFTTRHLGRAGVWVGATGLVASLSCGDSTGAVSKCPGDQSVRLHFVNITDTPGLKVSATYGDQSCGPVDLPVTDAQGGLELAQLLIEGQVGTVITVQVTNELANGAATECRITALAAPGQGITEDKLQTFVNVSGGPPLNLMCAEGLEAVPSP